MVNNSSTPAQIRPGVLVVRFALAFAVIAGVLFGSAGSARVPMFWLYLGLFAAFVVVSMAVMVRHDPGLLRERFRPGPGSKERVARPLLIVLIFLHWIVAGLDVGRFGWSGGVSPYLQAFGVLVMATAMFGWTWAMYSNHFFSSEVRIQTERGHQVVRGGPYRFLRHPGYAAGMLLFAADPLVLGSWWSGLPMIGVLAVFVWRTAFEDRVLLAELPGYREYAGEVRYRLMPGVW